MKSVILAASIVFVMGAFCGSFAWAAWSPAGSNLTTPWTAQVSPSNALPEYPRPQMTRANWLSLNGLWEFAAAKDGDTPPIGKTLPEQILVPFPVESSLSGLGRHESQMWYRRTFDVPSGWAGQHVILHFGAIDWQCSVTLNGRQIGSHRGGYDRFSFDITSSLNPTGPQELIVYVADPTDSGPQARGKQVLNPTDIWFSPSSGIWQTVWLEPVPVSRISSVKAVPDIDAGLLRVNAAITNAKRGDTVRVVAKDGATIVGAVEQPVGSAITIAIPNAHLWSVDDPFLYTLSVGLYRGGSKVDEIGSYFGMRKISVGKDAKGITRILFNNKFVFQVGPLDQGYWPDGLYTAPTDDALRFDIEATRKLGFNFTRKHVKVEPDRWYYWCDKLGLMVWQDMPSPGVGGQDARIQFEKELKRMVEGLWNHPSIIMWVPFNEGWGEYDAARIAKRVKEMDPSRLVDNASGWNDAGAGDVVDMHIYPGPNSPNPEANRAAVCGEFGDAWEYYPGHVWTRPGYTYLATRSPEEITHRYEAQLRTAYALKDSPGMSACVYTEITDVEVEQAGFLTYDRRINKLDPVRQALYNKGQFPNPLSVTLYAPTSETQATTWKYTLTQPADNWMSPDFNDASWTQGSGAFGQGSAGAVYRTAWSSPDIWVRRVFPVNALSGVPCIRLRHDEDVEAYLNGALAVSEPGFTSTYWNYDVLPSAASALKVGTNVLAIHCHQTGGSQIIDAGVGYHAVL
ncbi:MAG TPA: glycoside hydrolase family 2 TIM barrel-domain containing protein [Armatimonadota bacterium]|jgi:hypothetical protein